MNTGVMLLRADAPAAHRLLAASWEQTAFVPNWLGAEQSALRYTLYREPALRVSATIYQNLVRYPASFAMSARQKWNRTFRVRRAAAARTLGAPSASARPRASAATAVTAAAASP